MISVVYEYGRHVDRLKTCLAGAWFRALLLQWFCSRISTIAASAAIGYTCLAPKFPSQTRYKWANRCVAPARCKSLAPVARPWRERRLHLP